MSILIKGMDKPTDCGLCPFEDFGYCSVKGERNTSESGIDADCPLIEVADRKTEPSFKVDEIGDDDPTIHAIAYLQKVGWLQEHDRALTEQTEPNSSEIPNNCEHITEDGVTCAKYPACDDCPDNPLNKVKGSKRLLKGKDKPQTEEDVLREQVRAFMGIVEQMERGE